MHSHILNHSQPLDVIIDDQAGGRIYIRIYNHRQTPRQPCHTVYCVVFECPAFEHLRADSRHLFGPEVAFDMRRFFAHKGPAGRCALCFDVFADA